MSNEHLWEGTFGDEYVVRNDIDFGPRRDFFKDLFYRYPIENILEIGCNIGMNLDIISEGMRSIHAAWGCDVNQRALNLLHLRHKELNAVWCSGFDLPFRDGYFDCVMTCGVLIHQKPDEVERMMQEIIRVSGKYVLGMEYALSEFKEEPEKYPPGDFIFQTVPYRGHDKALFRGPYGEIYEKRYGLKLLETGFLDKTRGFDEVTYWMLAL